jgi:RNA binding exosome subunit
MIAHFVELSVFSTPEDDEAQVYRGFVSLVPFSLETEKLRVEKINASGFTERKIIIFKVRLTKQRHINEFLENLAKTLNEEQKELLARQADSRLDSELYFYIRLRKTELIETGKYWITDEGNCYHLKIALAAFPRKREVAIGLLSSWLSNSKAI